jgi:hypothetical protein
MTKTPYLGDEYELRIDGYYYSNIVYDNYRGVAIFTGMEFCLVLK